MTLALTVPVSNRKPRRIRRGSLPTGNPQSTSRRLSGLVRSLPALLGMILFKRLPGSGPCEAILAAFAARISFRRLPGHAGLGTP